MIPGCISDWVRPSRLLWKSSGQVEQEKAIRPLLATNSSLSEKGQA